MLFVPSASLCSPQEQFRSTLLYMVTERFNRTETLTLARCLGQSAAQHVEM